MALHLTLQHILPLMLSSGSFALCAFQFPVFNTFLTAKPSIAGQPLSSYWRQLTGLSLTPIIAPLVMSGVVGFTAAWSVPGTAAKYWYFFGAVSAWSHFLFVPLVAPLIRGISSRSDMFEKLKKDADSRLAEAQMELEASNRRQQVQWLRIHAVRTVTVDLAAVICFYMALMNLS